MALFGSFFDQLCFLFFLGCGGLLAAGVLLIRSGAGGALAQEAGKGAAQQLLEGFFKKR
ncbi:hypothetical protein VT84_06820 [Gemmata sp. SH-PL17]|uniref:hypothetical protein n=1 Tax=Gemmata sp. SH-PL17 TaxID=1630693 RepID=UPI00078BF6BD|nr:hypothetical protein [Gemmata sp. SH-PL17]AMV24091.1 hypothetical protein VT84_06820 [Gemmata sp. SH-PL17]